MKTLLVLALALALARPASADLSYDSICGSTMTAAQSAAAPAPAAGSTAAANDPRNTQKYSYCQAAQQDKDAASKNGALWKVWAAVAGVCIAGCATSWAGGGTACTAANMGAGVTDGLVNKQFAGSMTNVGMSFAASKGMAGKGKAGGKMSACIAAATATMQVITKKKSADAATADMQSSLQSATQVTDANQAGLVVTGPPTNKLGSGNLSPDGGTVVFQGGLTPVKSPAVGVKEPTAPSAACAGTDGTSIYQCAVASDSNLPDFAKTNDFGNEIQANTGMPLPDFLGKVSDPHGAILAAAGGAVAGSAVNTNLEDTRTAIADMQKALDDEAALNSTYAGGGAMPATEKAAGAGEPPVADMVAAMLKGMGVGAKDEKKDDSNNISFAPRAPASRGAGTEAEDRGYSLFDRVTYRYFFVAKRLLNNH